MVIDIVLESQQYQFWHLCNLKKISFKFMISKWLLWLQSSCLYSSKGEGGKWKAWNPSQQLFISPFKVSTVSHHQAYVATREMDRILSWVYCIPTQSQDFVVKREGVIGY